MIVSCGFLEDELLQCSNEGMTMARSVETLGVDSRTRVKRLEVKEKARRKKCKARFSLIKKNKVFQKSYMKVGVKKLLRAGMVPARTWGVDAVVMALPERIKLRRQMAASAGKKSTTSLSLVTEVFGFEVEEALCTMATQACAEVVWIVQMAHRTKRTTVEIRFWRFRCGDK